MVGWMNVWMSELFNSHYVTERAHEMETVTKAKKMHLVLRNPIV